MGRWTSRMRCGSSMVLPAFLLRWTIAFNNDMRSSFVRVLRGGLSAPSAHRTAKQPLSWRRANRRALWTSGRRASALLGFCRFSPPAITTALVLPLARRRTTASAHRFMRSARRAIFARQRAGAAGSLWDVLYRHHLPGTPSHSACTHFAASRFSSTLA